jgi:hypothetical protein
LNSSAFIRPRDRGPGNKKATAAGRSLERSFCFGSRPSQIVQM